MSDTDGTAQSHNRVRMLRLIQHLLAEAPKMEGAPADDPGAIEAQVVLRSGFTTRGALTMNKDGLVKLLVIGRPQGSPDGHTIAALHYFDPGDIEALVVLQAKIAPDDRPRIFTGQT